MNRETIEKAANEYAYKQSPDAGVRYDISYGFIAGAEWRINSVWQPNDDGQKRLF